MRNEREKEDDETSSSEEDDDFPTPPVPVEKRVRIIDPKGDNVDSPPLAEASSKAGTSSFQQDIPSPRLPAHGPAAMRSPQIDKPVDYVAPSTSRMIPLTDELVTSTSSSSEVSFFLHVVTPVVVEKRVVIIDPKEEEEERIREEEKKITFTSDVKSPKEDSETKLIEDRERSVTFSYDDHDTSKLTQPDTQSGKQNMYSKYMEQNASVLRDSRRSFLFERSQSDVNVGTSVTDIDENKNGRAVVDFTHGYQENKQYIIPPMSEHEIHRLSSSRHLEDAQNITSEVSVKDHVYLSLAYLTVNNKHDLKEIFTHVAENMQSYGKVYSARMLGRYHDYARLFQFSAGNEGGIVASMRFTSHCSDIIKSYIQLAALIEDADEFTRVIVELAKRHVKLGLSLRDHQAHYRRFVEIFGSSENHMKIYPKIYLFVCLVSRSMLLAEQKLRKTDPEEDALHLIATRLEKAMKPKEEYSKKQPIWD